MISTKWHEKFPAFSHIRGGCGNSFLDLLYDQITNGWWLSMNFGRIWTHGRLRIKGINIHEEEASDFEESDMMPKWS